MERVDVLRSCMVTYQNDRSRADAEYTKVADCVVLRQIVPGTFDQHIACLFESAS